MTRRSSLHCTETFAGVTARQSRFDADIIEIYVQFSEAADIVHNNAGGDPDEARKAFWDLVRPVTASAQRPELSEPESFTRSPNGSGSPSCAWHRATRTT